MQSRNCTTVYTQAGQQYCAKDAHALTQPIRVALTAMKSPTACFLPLRAPLGGGLNNSSEPRRAVPELAC